MVRREPSHGRIGTRLSAAVSESTEIMKPSLPRPSSPPVVKRRFGSGMGLGQEMEISSSREGTQAQRSAAKEDNPAVFSEKVEGVLRVHSVSYDEDVVSLSSCDEFEVTLNETKEDNNIPGSPPTPPRKKEDAPHFDEVDDILKTATSEDSAFSEATSTSSMTVEDVLRQAKLGAADMRFRTTQALGGSGRHSAPQPAPKTVASLANASSPPPKPEASVEEPQSPVVHFRPTKTVEDVILIEAESAKGHITSSSEVLWLAGNVLGNSRAKTKLDLRTTPSSSITRGIVGDIRSSVVGNKGPHTPSPFGASQGRFGQLKSASQSNAKAKVEESSASSIASGGVLRSTSEVLRLVRPQTKSSLVGTPRHARNATGSVSEYDHQMRKSGFLKTSEVLELARTVSPTGSFGSDDGTNLAQPSSPKTVNEALKMAEHAIDSRASSPHSSPPRQGAEDRSGANSPSTVELDDAYYQLPGRLAESPNMSRTKVLDLLDGVEGVERRGSFSSLPAGSSLEQREGDEDDNSSEQRVKGTSQADEDERQQLADKTNTNEESAPLGSEHVRFAALPKALPPVDYDRFRREQQEYQPEYSPGPLGVAEKIIDDITDAFDPSMSPQATPSPNSRKLSSGASRDDEDNLMRVHDALVNGRPIVNEDGKRDVSEAASISMREIPVDDHLMISWMDRVKDSGGDMDGTTGSRSFEVDDGGNAFEEIAEGSMYTLGESTTIVTHQIFRGNWSWCTAWSPDGNRLAIATENHHLAIVDTSMSTVWKVVHDRRLDGETVKKDTTHTIRAVAWGSQYIAIGGTGDAVSLLLPESNYPLLHVIRGTGFVGCLEWRADSSVLAIGSREDRCMIVQVDEIEVPLQPHEAGPRDDTAPRTVVTSRVMHTTERTDWVNAVSFSPGGRVFAVGDRSGILSVYVYVVVESSNPILSLIKDFYLEDSILDVKWSPDGMWLYAGGEDFTINVISSYTWELLHSIERDRWVQFISPSCSGKHIAVGGGNSEVAILEVKNYWKPVKRFPFQGASALSGEWHPRDRFLAITGQSNSIVAVETTGLRYNDGKYVRSKSPILSADFAPDGGAIAVGSEDGLLSVFDTTAHYFVTLYDTIVGDNGAKCVRWSPDGKTIAVASGGTLAILNAANSGVSNGQSPACASRFSVQKLIRGLENIESIAFSPNHKMLAVCAQNSTRIMDIKEGFETVRHFKKGMVLASSWSPDGTLFAMVGCDRTLTIYDTSTSKADDWRVIFTMKCGESGMALAWGMSVTDGLQYLAYGGKDKKVTILEIRTHEVTWETVIEISRQGAIYDLDWNDDGMLAVAVGNGTLAIIDLGYLQSGTAVNEMNYNWQRQGMTCLTELQRTGQGNSMRTLRWMPRQGKTEPNLLAFGGTDGIIEIMDLSPRKKLEKRIDR